MYRCTKCGVRLSRWVDQAWIKSYCGNTGQFGRLVREQDHVAQKTNS